MNKTEINYEMTAEQYDRIVQCVKGMDAELGFTINLTMEQNQRLSKLGDKSVAFVDKTMTYSTDRPDLIPPCSDMIDFKRDYELANKLRQLIEITRPVLQKMKDSYFLVGANTLMAARKFYGYIKAAAVAGAPGATAIRNDLRKRYAKIKSTEMDTEPSPMAPTATTQE